MAERLVIQPQINKERCVLLECPLQKTLEQLNSDMTVLQARVVCERGGLGESFKVIDSLPGDLVATIPNSVFECNSAELLTGTVGVCGVVTFFEPDLFSYV